MAILSTLTLIAHGASSLSLSSAIGSLVTLLATWIVYRTYVYPNLFSPLRHLPGPPVPIHLAPIVGHMSEVFANEAGLCYRRWIEQYGGLVRCRGLMNQEQVLLGDPVAIHHVYSSRTYDYIRDERIARLIKPLVGRGLLLAEGDHHQKSRRMLNPAFSYRHLKELIPLMAEPATKLAKKWTERIHHAGSNGLEFFVDQDMARVTLDIIGLAGFGYSFDSLTNSNNELNQAYSDFFSSSSEIIIYASVFIPFYTFIPFYHNRARWRALRVINRVTAELVREKRRHIEENMKSGAELDDSNPSHKDLMTILIRGNEAVGSLEDGKLTDEEVRDHLMTFLFAGHETTSVLGTWSLHLLSIHPKIQSRLRQELLDHIGPLQRGTYTSPNASYNALSNLPFLAAFVKEVLRWIAPVPNTVRTAAEDDEILGYMIPKGTFVVLSPAALHKLKAVWGPDAEEFKPERWMDAETAKAADTTMVTPDMNWAFQPFLSGPRNCIGFKFALIEIKVLLYHLLVGLEYLPSPGFEFKKSVLFTSRPDPGMKLLVKRFVPAPPKQSCNQ